VIVENMHDVPWLRPEQLGPETVSAMTVVCSAVRRVHTEFPVGIQILSSGNRAAVAVARAAGDKIFSLTRFACSTPLFHNYVIIYATC